MLGYPDRAADHTREALALARSLDQPFGVSYACHLAAALYRWRGEYQVVEELEEEALAHDREHGFGLLLTAGVIQRGWILAERGKKEEGLAQMQEGLAKHREIGAVVLAPAFMAVMAELHQKLGRPAEALSTVTEALRVAQQSGQHYWESELYRLIGVLTLEAATSPGPEAASAAESHFLRALEIARRQKAEMAGAARGDEPDSPVGRPGQGERRRARCCRACTGGSRRGARSPISGRRSYCSTSSRRPEPAAPSATRESRAAARPEWRPGARTATAARRRR